MFFSQVIIYVVLSNVYITTVCYFLLISFSVQARRIKFLGVAAPWGDIVKDQQLLKKFVAVDQERPTFYTLNRYILYNILGYHKTQFEISHQPLEMRYRPALATSIASK